MTRRKDLRRIEQAMVELNRLARSGQGDAERAERAGVSIPGAAQRVLYQLVERGDARLTDLARRTGGDPGILSRQIDLLEEVGLVVRTPDPNDGRARVLRVTAQGRRVSARLRRAQDETFATLLARWSATDLAAAAEVMERLARDLRPGVGADPAT